MKKVVKKIVLVATLMLFVVSMGIFVTGCSKKIDSIVVQDEPRLVYVQGQDLDLSEGSITVKQKKKTSQVALSNSEVSISGYKKDQLGDQELTITYKEKTTTYTIKVIPWVEVIAYETNYFIDDSFNKNKGSLKIAKEDGTVRTISMSDERVTVEGFNSKSAVQGLTLTAKYTDGGVVREGDFTVNIYDAEEAHIYTDHINKNYGSHETEINLSGGYIMVTAANGQLQKEIPITQDMVKGYDPSKADESNIETPLEQKVIISFGSFQKEITVKITYSDVSYVLDRVADVIEQTQDVDWSATTITIDNEVGIKAEEAMIKYFSLSSADKKYIDTKDLENIARCALIYDLDQYNKQKTTAFKVLELSNDGIFSIKYDSKYEDVKYDLEKLNNSNDFMVYVVPLLNNIAKDFGKVTIANTTIADCLGSLYNENDVKLVKDILNLLVYIYDEINYIKVDWTMEDLEANSIHIKSVVTRLSNSQYSDINYSSFISSVSKWREKDDLFDIIYYYYTYSEDLRVGDIFSSVNRPHEVEQLYINFYYAFSELVSYIYPYAKGVENNLFYLYFRDTIDMYYDIVNGDNQLYKDILEEADMGSLIFINIMQTINSSYGNTGFYKLAGAFAETDEFNALLDKYLDTVGYYHLDPNNYDGNVNAKETDAFFKAFVEASPTMQYAFIGSVSQLYFDNESQSYRIMDITYSQDNNNYIVSNALTYVLADHYGKVLPDGAKSILPDLLAAIEDYALRDKFSNAEEEFKDSMKAVIDAVAKLKDENPNDYEKFNEVLGYAYDKYENIYNNINDDIYADVDLGEWKDDFDTLKTIISDMKSYADDIENYRTSHNGNIPLFELDLTMINYEKALQIMEAIYDSGDEDVINYFCYATNTFSRTICTYEYALWTTFTTYNNYMTSIITGNEFIRGIYKLSDLDTIFADFYTVMENYHDEETIDEAEMATLINKFVVMDDESKIAMFRIGMSESYYGAMNKVFERVLTDTEKAFADALINAEKKYVDYAFAPNAVSEADGPTHIEEFKSAMATLIDLKETIEESDNYTTYLKTAYEIYLAEYNELIAE